MSDESGFRPEPRVYHLTFPAHPDVPGMQVRLASMSILERLEFDTMRFTPVANALEIPEKDRRMAQALAERLISWNVLDPKTGDPVPPTLEGILSLDDWVINPIVEAWIDAITGVRRPLAPPASADGMEVMDSIPVQPLT